MQEDKRLRFWDTNDGRCFNISSNSLFPQSFKLIQMETFPIDKEESQSSRFLFCIGNWNKLSVVDLWKMEVMRHFDLGVGSPAFFKLNKDSMTMELLSIFPFLLE
jgi:hypothetical protein